MDGSGIAPREYETVPAERTPDNPLGAYALTPGRVRTSTPEELAEKRLEARNVRSARFRDLYQSLDLAMVVHKDGTLDVAWLLEAPARVLPTVVPASPGTNGR